MDQTESPICELELELLGKFSYQKIKYALTDISNQNRLEILFED